MDVPRVLARCCDRGLCVGRPRQLDPDQRCGHDVPRLAAVPRRGRPGARRRRGPGMVAPYAYLARGRAAAGRDPLRLASPANGRRRHPHPAHPGGPLRAASRPGCHDGRGRQQPLVGRLTLGHGHAASGHPDGARHRGGGPAAARGRAGPQRALPAADPHRRRRICGHVRRRVREFERRGPGLFVAARL